MELQDSYYDMLFENEFLKTKADAFQDLFERLMISAYGSDFIPCCTWGSDGDQKNDGFLTSEQRLFQVYAPHEMTKGAAKKKINEDFEGAKLHWGEHFSIWTFVHNAHHGLPPHVVRLLLDLGKVNPSIMLEQWGFEKLREIFRKVPVADRISWFGYVPTEETKAKLGFKEIQIVIESLAHSTIPVSVEVSAIPPGKMEANALSESISHLFKSGMAKAPLVSEFLQNWHDETLGERLASAFREKYFDLRSQPVHPNLIFREMQTWVGGSERGTPEHEMAVLAVMAYYFERCDFFEEPKSKSQENTESVADGSQPKQMDLFSPHTKSQ